MKLRMSGLLSLFDEEKKKSFFIYISFFLSFSSFFQEADTGMVKYAIKKKEKWLTIQKEFSEKGRKTRRKAPFSRTFSHNL